MLIVRMTIAGALAVAAIGTAAAQTASDAPAGKPIPLLQVLQAPERSQTKPHVKLAAKRVKKARVAAVRRAKVPERAAETRTAEWPQIKPAAIERAEEQVAAPAAPAAQPTELPVSEFVVKGQTVKVAQADAVNEIDLATKFQEKPKDTPAASPQASSSQASSSQTSSPQSDLAAAVTASAAVVAAQPQPPSKIGSPSWLAQVAAALGGAIAAGSVGWFLIGPAPLRQES
jgi:hypothetical protein